MRPEMVVLDIDKTLVWDDSDTVHPVTLEALGRLHREPVMVTLATGRPLPSALRIAHEIRARYLVACGGALLVRVQDERALWRSTPISRDDTARLWESGTRLHAHTDDGAWYATHDDEITDKYAQVYGMPGVQWGMPNRPPLMIEAVDVRLDPADYPGLTVAHASAHGHEYSDVTPGGVDKATGVSHLLDRLEIPWSALLAIGDGDNDATLFARAGRSVAVEGATPALLKHATHQVLHGPETGAVGVALMALVYGGDDQRHPALKALR